MEREALKLALKALEDLPGFRADIDNAITAIKEALAQPAQEPVKCLDCGSNNVGLPATYDSLVDSVKAQPAQEPVQREWVGLTDEEIDEGNKQSWVSKQAWQSAVWWASEKLKEKNG